jgi:hypothetical protein
MPDRFPGVRQVAVLAACFIALIACGASAECVEGQKAGKCVAASNGDECPAIGLPSGVSVRVAEELAAAVTAEITVCEGEACQTRRVPLTPSTAPSDPSCAGDNCGAALVPTGGKNGWVTLDMPVAAVRVTVKLFDAAGEPVAEGSVETTAKGSSSTTCATPGRQVALAMSRAGVTAI